MAHGNLPRLLDILNEYEDGQLSVSQIAKRYNVHHTYPTILARRYGLTMRRPDLSKPRNEDEFDDGW